MATYDEMQAESTRGLLSDGTTADFGPETTTATIDISDDAALSDVINKIGHASMAVHMPAAWTAASLGLKAAPTEDGTYSPVYDRNGSLVSISVDASRVIVFDMEVVTALRYIKLWSHNGSGTDEDQAEDRTFYVDLY